MVVETFFAGIGNFALSAFTSLFANKIDRQLQNMDIVKNFNKVDMSIINEIADKIYDEYYSEKLKEQIMKDRLFLSREINFITEEEREDFIDKFYKENADLKYVGSSRINECLNSYIDLINEELNKRISQEGKVIIGRIQKSEKNIIGNQDSNTDLIIKKIDELKKNNQEQVTYRNYNIPIANKLFCGREDHLHKILSSFKSTNLVVINGLGGIGKTQIAKKYIGDYKQEYNIIVWISGEDIEELNNSYRQVALFYNLIENNKKYDQVHINDLVKNYLNEIEKSLLIIDGVDDVEFGDLINYLPSSANIIITTQNSNIDSDEFNIISVGDFTKDEATNFLLFNTSNRIRTANDLNEAKELTFLMEYYPLALEYSRAYINKHKVSIKDYKELYQEHRVTLLTSKLPSYKKTIYTTWKISFDKATEQNRNTYNVMAMCSFFAAVRIPFRYIFSKSAYKIGDLVEIEETLLNYSLITIDGGYIGVHGITQEFIRNMLNEKNESIKYLEEDIELLISNIPQKINDKETSRKVVDLLPHARKVVDFCKDKKVKKADEFCGIIGNRLYILGMYVDSIKYINKAIALYFKNKEYFKYVEYTTFLIQANHYTGNSSKALAIGDEILRFIEIQESLNGVQKEYLNGNILGAIGIVQKDLGEIDIALSYFENSLKCYERLGDVDGQINQLNNIGIVYKNQQEYDLAMDIYSIALDLCDQDKRNKGKILGNIGFIYKIQGDIPNAFSAFTEALGISQEIGDLRSECIDYHHIGECWLQMGNIRFTEENLEKSLTIAKRINFVMGLINVYNTYGLLNLRVRNDLVKAREYFEKAYKQSDQIGYAHGKDYASYYLQYIGSTL